MEVASDAHLHTLLYISKRWPTISFTHANNNATGQLVSNALCASNIETVLDQQHIHNDEARVEINILHV